MWQIDTHIEDEVNQAHRNIAGEMSISPSGFYPVLDMEL